MQGDGLNFQKNNKLINFKDQDWQEKFKLMNNGIVKREKFIQKSS